jgi:phage terminase large subunit GpA-like protein
MVTIDDVRRRALAALRPPPRLRLSEWIERELRLPEGTTALPGRVRLFPFQRGIADAISDPLIERVTLVKPARLGFTTLLTAAIGAYVANGRRQSYAFCRPRAIAGIRADNSSAYAKRHHKPLQPEFRG